MLSTVIHDHSGNCKSLMKHAGLFAHCSQGKAVKYLGSTCQSEVCEANCPGQHQFYRARILPPRALPDPGSSTAALGAGDAELAASLVQAHAATTGRPVLLILDLHPGLRSRSLEGLLQIPEAEQLQVSWHQERF